MTVARVTSSGGRIQRLTTRSEAMGNGDDVRHVIEDRIIDAVRQRWDQAATAARTIASRDGADGVDSEEGSYAGRIVSLERRGALGERR